MSTNIEVHREKAEVRNNLDKEELLTEKNKKANIGRIYHWQPT